MCDFLSFLVHERADKLPLSKRYLFGDLLSHSGTAQLHGLEYGNPDVWREVEWTGDGEKKLSVRAMDCQTSSSLKSLVLEDFPERNLAICAGIAKLPESVTTLYLNGTTVPAELKLPESARIIR